MSKPNLSLHVSEPSINPDTKMGSGSAVSKEGCGCSGEWWKVLLLLLLLATLAYYYKVY